MESPNKNLDSYPKQENNDSKEVSTVDRKWVALTAYQPVDVVTKTVEVPVIKTVEKIVPKTIVQEKIVHVPKNVTHIVEKIVEVPEVKYIEKVVEVPHIHYKNKYVPKIEVVEKIIERQKIIEKWHDKIVEVPQIKEVVRYKQIEDVEEIIKYIPKDSGSIDWEAEYRKYLQRKELAGYNSDNTQYNYQHQIDSYNDYNERAYIQNSYNRTYDYPSNQAISSEPTDHTRGVYSPHTYYNQYNAVNNEREKVIPKSNFRINEKVQIKRLQSEDVKPVGCCGGACS